MFVVLANASDGGSAILSQVGLAVAAVVVALIALAFVVRVARRLRQSAPTSRRMSARWIKSVRALVELVLVVFVLVVPFEVLAVATGSESASVGVPGVEIYANQIEMRVTSSIRWYSSDVSRDVERWYGRGAKPVQGEQVDIIATEPGLGLLVLALFAIAVVQVAVTVFLLALRSVLIRAEDGMAFASRSVVALRWMAYAVAVGSIFDAACRWFLAREIMTARGGEAATHLGLPVVPLLASAVLLALAEVWRYGVALQDDAKATV